MSKKDILRIPDYLEHIIEAIERIHRYVKDMSEVGFLDDEKTQDAVVCSAIRTSVSGRVKPLALSCWASSPALNQSLSSVGK